VWDVESVLTGVELPLGPEFVPDMRVRSNLIDLYTTVQLPRADGISPAWQLRSACRWCSAHSRRT
jgi:hypothetical protein